MKLQQKGFTIVELMVTIAVAATLLSLAIPSFTDSIKRNRIASTQHDLFGALVFARSEAVNQSLPVSLCASANQTSCGTDWSAGWIVFVDLDGDGSIDAGSDQVLRVRGAVSGATVALGSGSLAYDNQGRASSGTFTFCDVDQDAKYTKAINIANTGRIMRAQTEADGSALSCS